MNLELLPADYVLGALTLVAAVMGLFRGFSGVLGFLSAALASSVSVYFAWPFLSGAGWERWMACAVALVIALVTFGLARCIIKKIVNGLLSQPTDAILGMILGAGFGALVVVAWAYSGMFLEYSAVASFVAALL